MHSNNENKAIVVTGASTGIGEAVARHLDASGYRVFAGVRKQRDAEKLRQGSSARLVPIFLDVTDEVMISEAAKLVAKTMGEHGVIGLVNNAGIAIVSPLEFLPIEEFRKQLEINVIGQMAVTQAFLPLIRQGGGRLVFVSSISGRVAAPLVGPYAASKFALGAIADSIRRELLPWKIHVSLIEPGKIETPIWEKTLTTADAIADSMPRQAEEYYGQDMYNNRKRAMNSSGGASVEKVAQTVAKALFSRSPKTRYLVGWDARLGSTLVKFFPDKVLDRLITWQRGMRSSN